MLDHVSIAVIDYQESIRFYDETLAVLGYKRVVDISVPEIECAGYGTEEPDRLRPYFWISTGGKDEEYIGQARGFHISFQAKSVEAVHQWYQKCVELGGKDNGAPGPRPHYHPRYYGAFVIDPNGWRIEAAFHEYEGSAGL